MGRRSPKAHRRGGWRIYTGSVRSARAATNRYTPIALSLPISPQPTSPELPSAGGNPLSADHLNALANARLRSKKVRRAAGVATVGGWTMGVFAAATLIGGLLGDWVALALGIGLGVVAYNELRGAAKLRRFEVAGTRLLGWNQIGLGAMLVVYAAWSLWSALSHPMLEQVGATGDADMDAMIGRISTMASWGMYGGVAVVGVIGPGLTAWYYFSRAKVVRKMVEETPAWVIEAMRATN